MLYLYDVWPSAVVRAQRLTSPTPSRNVRKPCGGNGMKRSDKTARELYEAIKANPTRKRFGFGTVVVTGGSTSGCVRATVIDSLSRSFRTIVAEEGVADKHESPHFANLYDMALKYADVIPVAEVLGFMGNYHPLND